MNESQAFLISSVYYETCANDTQYCYNECLDEDCEKDCDEDYKESKCIQTLFESKIFWNIFMIEIFRYKKLLNLKGEIKINFRTKIGKINVFDKTIIEG